MKKVSVIQSNYLPWKGYFDIINEVDLFVFYDDVQFTKNDWRNRNIIKSQGGNTWLSVPTGASIDRLVCEVDLKNNHWQKKHWKTICQNYSNARYFGRYRGFFEEVLLDSSWDNLSTLNQYLIQEISSRFLGIKTEFTDSRIFPTSGDKLERLLDLLKILNADVYLSGPTAKSYIDEEAFIEVGIKLEFKSYEGYPEYTQFFPPFNHHVSIIDLLFHTGPDAPNYIWGWRNGEAKR